MSEKNYKLPVVAWLKVTDYMHGWLQRELAGGARVGDKRVVCVQHLPGAREVLRMETSYDVTRLEDTGCGSALSATRRNCIEAGMALDEETVSRLYGMTRKDLSLYVPIECPRTCLTANGVLRPWTNDVCFGHRQAFALLRLLREAFWQGVAEYDAEYARKKDGVKYAAIDMIESFCRDMDISDMHVEAMRREWQRRQKRQTGG